MSAIDLSLHPSIDLTVSITANKPRNMAWVVINGKWIAEAKTGSLLRFQHISRQEQMKFTAAQINDLTVSVMCREQSENWMIKGQSGNFAELSTLTLTPHQVQITYPEQCDAQHQYELEIDANFYLFKGTLVKRTKAAELGRSHTKVHQFLHDKLKTLLDTEAQVLKFDSTETKWKPCCDDRALSDAIIKEILSKKRNKVIRLSRQIRQSTDGEAFASCVNAIKYDGFYRIFRTVLETRGYEFDSTCAAFADRFAKAAVQQIGESSEDQLPEQVS